MDAGSREFDFIYKDAFAAYQTLVKQGFRPDENIAFYSGHDHGHESSIASGGCARRSISCWDPDAAVDGCGDHGQWMPSTAGRSPGPARHVVVETITTTGFG